ncbi:MAG: glycosyltransferase, partial [Chloroflexota bacterium]
MRILTLTHNYPRFVGDFSGTFIKALSDALCAAGHDAIVLTPYDTAFAPLTPSGRGDGGEGRSPRIITYRYIWPARLHQLGYMRTLEADVRLRGWAQWLAPFLFLFGTLAAWRIARRERPDIIHAHWVLPNGFIGALVSRWTGIPLVVSLPGSDVTMAGHNRIFNWLANFAWRTASLITTNSADLRDEAIRLGAPANKFDLIIYGVNKNDFTPSGEGTRELRASLGLADDDVVVLAVGRMVHKKGFDVLIRAMAHLHELHSHVKAVLVGDGDLIGQWQLLAQELSVADRVLFVGRVPHDEIARYYNMCDLLAMPSVTYPADGLNVCVVDAMACGKPIVASRAAGNPLVVADGLNGLRVDENRPDQLAHAIARLADAPGLRAHMGAESRRRIEDEFDWTHLAQRYLDHFADILNVKRDA